MRNVKSEVSECSEGLTGRERCVGCWSWWQELETDVTVCGELIDYFIFTFLGCETDMAAENKRFSTTLCNLF